MSSRVAVPPSVHISVSVYRLLLDEAEKRGASFRSADRPPDPSESPDGGQRFVASVTALHRWCRWNERLVTRERLSDARVYAGFQRLSRVRPVLERYRALSAVVSELVVFGEPDDALALSGANVVTTKPGPLTHEWFLVVESRRYCAVLAGIDLDGFDARIPHAERRFSAVSTHHGGVARACADALARAVEPHRKRTGSAGTG
jgi:DICT domain-containing protein